MDDKLLLEILIDYFKLSKELKESKESSDFWYKSWKELEAESKEAK